MKTSARRQSWHMLTGEYPPQPGGVSDYTQQLALALSETGEEVHVWAPQTSARETVNRIAVHELPDFGPRGLRLLSEGLAALPGPKLLLVQYVAAAFGYHGLNIPFALWLAAREEEVWVQFHEVAYSFAWRQPLQRNVLAAVEWWMAQLVAEQSRRVFISIPGWRRQLGRHASRAEVLPIPSNLPVEVAAADTARLRKHLGSGPLLGHFGTYGPLVAELLFPAVVSILRSVPAARFVLLGRGGIEFAARLVSAGADLEPRLVAPGAVAATSASLHLAACDVLVQPYPDGISGRRTSAMAGLALGKAIVTTAGDLTEAEWAQSEAVSLSRVGDTQALTKKVLRLLSVPSEREALGSRGRAWYVEHFSIARTLELLGVAGKVEPCADEH